MKNPHQEKLLQTAAQLGIATEDLSSAWLVDAVRYSRHGRNEVVLEGNALGSTPLLATTICESLSITRHLLVELGIPTPQGKFFKLESETTSAAQLQSLLDGFWKDGKVYSSRPAFSKENYGVASNIKTLTELELHLDTFADEFATWLLEEQVDGEDLQLLVIGGKLVAAILRSPLKLKGDGVHTLEELIDVHNKAAEGSDIVEIDADTRQLLRDQSVFLSEVVPQNQWVQLKSASAGGGDAVDVTARLHSRYGQWASAIATQIGLGLFTMDCRSSDPTQDPQEAGCVLSIQAQPQWLPFEQAQGNTQDFAQMLLTTAMGL